MANGQKMKPFLNGKKSENPVLKPVYQTITKNISQISIFFREKK